MEQWEKEFFVCSEKVRRYYCHNFPDMETLKPVPIEVINFSRIFEEDNKPSWLQRYDLLISPYAKCEADEEFVSQTRQKTRALVTGKNLWQYQMIFWNLLPLYRWWIPWSSDISPGSFDPCDHHIRGEGDGDIETLPAEGVNHDILPPYVQVVDNFFMSLNIKVKSDAGVAQTISAPWAESPILSLQWRTSTGLAEYSMEACSGPQMMLIWTLTALNWKHFDSNVELWYTTLYNVFFPTCQILICYFGAFTESQREIYVCCISKEGWQTAECVEMWHQRKGDIILLIMIH